MGAFAVGDILLARFPFSDLSHVKLRPVVVVGLSEFDNIIVAQITSKTADTRRSITISNSDVVGGDVFRSISYIRTSKIFTTDPMLIDRKLTSLKPGARHKLHKQLLGIFAPLAR